MRNFVVIAEHPPNLCPHSNAAARKQMERVSEIDAIAKRLAIEIIFTGIPVPEHQTIRLSHSKSFSTKSRAAHQSSRATGQKRPLPNRHSLGQALATGLTGLGEVHDVRVRETADGEIVNFHCRVDPNLSVSAVHNLVDAVERGLRRRFPTIARVIGHAEPLR